MSDVIRLDNTPMDIAVKQNLDSGTHVNSETESETERTITPEELDKDSTSVGLNDEQKPDRSSDVRSEIIEIMEETQTEQTKMSEETDKERTSVGPNVEQKVADTEETITPDELNRDRTVGHNVEETVETSLRVHFETEAEIETEKTITPEELNKESFIEEGLNDEQKPNTCTYVDSEKVGETETIQTIMSKELDKERAPLGLDVDQTTETSTHVRSEIMVKTGRTIMQTDLGKDSDIVVPFEDQNLNNDKVTHFEENKEPEVAHKIVSEELDREVCTLVGRNDEQKPDVNIHEHSKIMVTTVTTETEQAIMAEELYKDKSSDGPYDKQRADTDTHGHSGKGSKTEQTILSEKLDKNSTTSVGRNDEQKPNAGTNVVETETEQMIMSEELDKDREQDWIFEKPMCLISSDNGRLEVVDDTVSALEKIEMPLNVVAIAGLYRTGKSYLMNRLAGRNSGFLMGSSIESCTKGIWAWCRPHPKKQNEVLLLLDTEGLGDATKGDIDHDNKIFTLTTLISSTLVYNVMSAFNQDAVEKLTYVTMLSQNIKVSANDSSNDGLESIMPQFVLCVRDFNLELEQNGEEITADEYLEMCLQTKTVETPEDEKYNRPRECIKKYFTRRKVFTFDRPAGRKVMRTLDLAREEDLNEDFVHETEKFLAYIYTCPGKYLLNKSPVTGSMLSKLLREYVTTISDGNVPCVEDAIMIMTRQENEKHAKVAVEEYKLFLKQIQLPVYNKSKLCDSNLKFKKEKLSSLQSKLMFDTDSKFQKSTKAEMETLYEQFERNNSDLLFEKCINTLFKMHEETVKANIKRGKYATSGGHDVYDKDIRFLYDEYNKELNLIDITERKRAQQEFERKMAHENKQIMTEDKKLTEKESKELVTTKLDTMKQELIQSQEKERIKLEAELIEQRRLYEERLENARKEEKERKRIRDEEHNAQIKRIKDDYEREQEKRRLKEARQIERMKAEKLAEENRMLRTRLKESEQGRMCYIS